MVKSLIEIKFCLSKYFLAISLIGMFCVVPALKLFSDRPTSYTVEKGDNLSTIAKKHHLQVKDILASNPELDANSIRVGQKLILPNKSSSEPLAFTPPTSGTVKNPFGVHDDLFYSGIEYLCTRNQDIKAAWKGKIVFVAPILGFGYTVIIEHGNELYTVYSSPSWKIHYQQGDRINQGDSIARIKGKNISFFFQVYKNGKPVDPAEYF